MSAGWTVHKFGGTSVANADRYRAAAEIILSQRSGERVAVVVSAMSGVTNALIESVNLAATQDDSYLQKLQSLENQHLEAGRADGRMVDGGAAGTEAREQDGERNSYRGK